ncbi:hypothetical protein J6590_078624 [Homalodisca vitripennis]|nr:hypothetical protein J6590_078624 [Homalodisca vitripennis]
MKESRLCREWQDARSSIHRPYLCASLSAHPHLHPSRRAGTGTERNLGLGISALALRKSVCAPAPPPQHPSRRAGTGTERDLGPGVSALALR